MAVKPILFSCAMVRAILEGQKFQTRRVIKPQTFYGDFYGPDFYTETIIDKQGHEQAGDEVFGIWHEEGEWGVKSKYQPGDILWVRETWQRDPCGFDEMPPENWWIYKATGELPDSCTNWRPSIHMPREAARIFLRVTGVRVERVQDIGSQGHHDDVLKEGYPFSYKTGNPTTDFMFLWNSINAKRGYGWDTNPWVWVINFERCEKPEAPNA